LKVVLPDQASDCYRYRDGAYRASCGQLDDVGIYELRRISVSGGAVKTNEQKARIEKASAPSRSNDRLSVFA
jgi:hypothetical protein